jgi:hypothetical protein
MTVKKECREMKQLARGQHSPKCPDCGSGCSALTLQPGLEVCNKCDTAALIPSKMDQWKPLMPMMADYEVHDDGTKKLLGWHPKSMPEACFAKK